MPGRLITRIKKFFTRDDSPRIITAGQHAFPAADVSHGARQVLERLTDAGYEAYLVGGSIRDGLLGVHPKDFDVATNAHPEQIQQVFRSCRLIGRRFRLAHVRAGREIIEVATFRGNHIQDEEDEHPNNVSEQGLILRDNVFGTVQEDAIRRDFTANALFYRHSDGAIIDYLGGFEDIRARRLRLIGDPEKRYREDPVRMLRAVRFAAKLGFVIEEATAAPIHDLANLIDHVPPARLFEEFLKLFLSGYAVAVWDLLCHFGLHRHLFELPEDTSESDLKMIALAMRNTDHRLAQDKPVTPAFLFAVLMWPAVLREWERLKAEQIPPVPAFQQAAQTVVSLQNERISVPKRFQMPMREIWDLQLRLPRRQGNRADQSLQHPRFRAGYDFLLLREECGELEAGLGEWWTRYQSVSEQERRNMITQLDTPVSAAPGKKRNRRGRRRFGPRPAPQQT